ncbi:alcohol dehydrogenase-like [Bradysia coprophila]|uniref:alcohol dehydrogenase-like n=1 Tax=Bradysia coprophila TaxID=38358 RepID=UPI00187DA644|nr:alcohol dehydrogenase-like [Bradysia coprophila]
MSFLSGKSAIVTGGCGGIGYEVVKAFLEQGIKNVAILDISDTKNVSNDLQTKYGDRQVLFIKTDVSKKDQVKSAFDEIVRSFERIDIVVGNAGILCESDYERTINVNLLGILHSTYAAIDVMSKEKGGNGGIIVNLSSVAGLNTTTWMPAYSAAKHGIVGLNRSFGDQHYFDKFGIKFITICPGATETSIVDDYETKVTFGDLESFNFQFQTAATVARFILKAIDSDKNGSVWIINNSAMTEVTLHQY